jgi:mRNA-degrading endonuclease toxin of MazEF toxin-antitoxin module
MAAHIPAKGDLIALTFDPQAGHEQKGRRPALVISNDLFNQRTGLAIVCPITNTRRDFPFHVARAARRERGHRLRHGRADQGDRLPGATSAVSR